MIAREDVPDLPVRPWALVAPKQSARDAYLYHGSVWADEVGSTVPEYWVRAALAAGTHFVAFEGVES